MKIPTDAAVVIRETMQVNPEVGRRMVIQTKKLLAKMKHENSIDPHYLKQEAYMRELLHKFVFDTASLKENLSYEQLKSKIDSFVAKQPRAAVMVIVDKGKVLTVSRRHRPEDRALPGGKLDPLETAEQAAIRETFEETGIQVTAMEFFHSRVDPTDGRVSNCYRATAWKGEYLNGEDGIETRWEWPESLLGDNCTFREYNRVVLSKLGLLDTL